MKTNFVIIGLLIFPAFISQGFASCAVNEDWKEAPCLGTIANGKYDQNEVNKWKDYYQHKGTEWMDQKRSEMKQAIDDDTLKNWVHQSTENANVYAYYYFSGRAPDIGEYHGGFEEFMINESSTIHDPYTDDERYQLAGSKVPLGGLGINPEFNQFIIIGIVIGVALPVGLIIFWRRK